MSFRGYGCSGRALAHERAVAAERRRVEKALAAASLKVDYVEFVDAATLKAVKKVAPGTACLVAAYDGATRLIDNRLF